MTKLTIEPTIVNLRFLKLTLGHDDNHRLNNLENRIIPDPSGSYCKVDGQYGKSGWGRHFHVFRHLAVLELEAETLVDRMDELDEDARRAIHWRIPLAFNKKLVLNPARTKREGWHGPALSKLFSLCRDPLMV